MKYNSQIKKPMTLTKDATKLYETWDSLYDTLFENSGNSNEKLLHVAINYSKEFAPITQSTQSTSLLHNIVELGDKSTLMLLGNWRLISKKDVKIVSNK